MVESQLPAVKPQVVIIGGGFGGAETAKALATVPVEVTLVDRSNHHLFQPLLYQVATAGLSPADIAIPIRSMLRWVKNLRVLMATVVHIDLRQRVVYLDDGEQLSYDHLVIAAGAQASYFGRNEWVQYAPPLKTIEDATRIRRDILLAFERAERTEKAEHRRREMTFVVIGGGPTGVELAGAVMELARRVLAADFTRVMATEPRIILIEGSNRLLGGMSPKSSDIALKALQDMGVEVRLGQHAQHIDRQGVHLASELIESSTVIWAAGVTANDLTRTLGVKMDRMGRIVVNSDCSVPGHPEVFSIGDIAAFTQDEQLLPGVSPVAMQQGRYVAEAIQRRLDGEHPTSFNYVDKGAMATIGRSRAVAEVGGLHLRGLTAWLTWLFVHLWFLVGFKNRVFVLLQWILAYVFYRRGARLITHVTYEEDVERREQLQKVKGGSDEGERSLERPTADSGASTAIVSSSS